MNSKAGKLAYRQRHLLLKVAGIGIPSLWIFAIILRATSLGGVWAPIENSTWLILLIWIGLYWLAAYVVLKKPPVIASSDALSSAQAWSRPLVILMSLSALGAALMIFDFAILRGYQFNTAAAAIRTEELNNAMAGRQSVSVISGAGRLLLPAFFGACIIAGRFWPDLSPRIKLFFALGTVFVFLEHFFFEGGRFFFAISAIVYAFAVLSRAEPKVTKLGREERRARIRKTLQIVAAVIAGTMLLSVIFYIFVDRVLQRGGYLWPGYLQFTSSFDIQPHYYMGALFEGPFGAASFSFSMLWMYITQGINEFDLLLSARYFEHAYGLYQIPHLALIILVIFGVDIRYDALTYLPTYGSYSTGLGHVYVDFGVLGVLASAPIAAWLVCASTKRLIVGQANWFSMMAPLFLVIVVFSPTTSVIPNVWPTLAWMALAALFRTKPRKLIV